MWINDGLPCALSFPSRQSSGCARVRSIWRGSDGATPRATSNARSIAFSGSHFQQIVHVRPAGRPDIPDNVLPLAAHAAHVRAAHDSHHRPRSLQRRVLAVASAGRGTCVTPGHPSDGSTAPVLNTLHATVPTHTHPPARTHPPTHTACAPTHPPLPPVAAAATTTTPPNTIWNPNQPHPAAPSSPPRSPTKQVQGHLVVVAVRVSQVLLQRHGQVSHNHLPIAAQCLRNRTAPHGCVGVAPVRHHSMAHLTSG